eukprot:CAMPEP_0184722592 /NCGR_PEP_ID=MMETSP0314-20130426/22628_1 /TAXON_ID=38298 /ORGANISM="Rhodella maculata, Strain CCMP 736" /LENGTH=43 /DNA_ID= /DNA_START= /DNA_END= /DNA_ORIENTATION=
MPKRRITSPAIFPPAIRATLTSFVHPSTPSPQKLYAAFHDLYE